VAGADGGLKVLLFDSMGLLYRGHYAFIKSPLRASDGTVTSGLHHLLSEIYRHRDALEPDLVGVVFDHPGPTFRSEMYDSYKANRPETPEELVTQSSLARRLVDLLGLPRVEMEGLEADDLIAGLAARAAAGGHRVTIVSSDKDLLQVLDEGITVIRPGRPGREARSVQASDVPDILGVRVDQVPDYMALVGDSSDNIPGARGIGPKTAKKLLSEWGSVDAMYENLERVEPRGAREKLRRQRDGVMLSRRLVRLDRPLPGEVRLDDLRPAPPDVEEATRLLQRLGMRSILDRLPRGEGAGCRVEIVEGVDGLEALPERFARGEVAVDTETDSPHPIEARAVGLALAGDGESACYLPLSGEGALPRGRVAETLRRIASNCGLVAQNAKFDLHVLRGLGVDWPLVTGDPFLADYLLRPGGGKRSLEALSRLYLGRDMDTYDQVLDGAGTLLEVPLERVSAYCCSDATAAMRLHHHLRGMLEERPELEGVYREVELPLVGVLLDMERRGVSLNRDSLEQLREEYSERLSQLASEASAIAGRPVNLNSPRQVSAVLFDDLGLEVVRKTSTGRPSSSMTVLAALRGRHRFVDLVIEHRELSKLLSTYIEKLPGFVSPSTGLIHTSFNQAVTATGRLSSSSPNLQNIPIRTARGRSIRRCFTPPGEGEVFVSADYSQIELRVLAHLAGEGALREAYRRGEDIHSRTARSVFGDDVPDMRRRAKEVNFSIVYGISPYGLASRLGVSRGEAAGIINRYFDTYPEVESFFRQTVAAAEASGETRTILGRRRDFSGLADARGSNRRSMERMVVNTTVQGSAADIMKMAMIEVHRRLAEELPRAGLVLQVHDELLLSVDADRAEEATAIMVEEMEGAADLEVPLEVETGIGRDWMEAQH
jgi:DNA polymerase-1